MGFNSAFKGLIGIHKKGPKYKCNNYRGITLQAIASKLYATTLQKLTCYGETFGEGRARCPGRKEFDVYLIDYTTDCGGKEDSLTL